MVTNCVEETTTYNISVFASIVKRTYAIHPRKFCQCSLRSWWGEFSLQR